MRTGLAVVAWTLRTIVAIVATAGLVALIALLMVVGWLMTDEVDTK